MKFTVEPTKQSWRSRGTNVRLWRGRTADGTPVLLAVVGIAAPDGTISDEHLQAVQGDAAPVDSVGPNGRTVLAAEPNGTDITFGWWWT